MKHHRDSWDRLYQARGKLWGGSPHPLPDLPPGSRVLELGCGSGTMIGPMLDHRWRITAIDCSPAAIKFCRQMKGAGSVDGFIVADAESLPFGECSFDAVFCNHLLGHLYRSGRVACAEEATRVLRSNGYLFLRAFTGDDMRAGRGTMVEPGTYLRGDGIITHYFSPEEVIRVFPTLTLVESSCPRWTIRIRGEDHQHAEIVAVFQK